MLSCKEITELATDFAEGHLSDGDRERFVQHVAGCRGCAAYVEQMHSTARALGALPEPALPVAVQAALLARFDEWAAQRSRGTPLSPERSGWAPLIPALATLAAFALLVALARHRSDRVADWLVAVAIAGAAATVATAWRRLAFRTVAFAAAAALLALAGTVGAGSFDVADGFECLLVIGGAAVAGGAGAWAAGKRRLMSVVQVAAGPWSVAGALTGVAALQLTCGAHSSLVHLLTFHVGGLVAVAAVAYLATRIRPQVVAG